jgi:hypothetical protein
MPKKRISRRVKDAGILPSVVMVLVTLLAAAAVLWVVFTRLLRDAWPWQEGGLETTNPTPAFQTTQLVLTLVGGIGAAILVVVAYRRQRDLELARFDERFAAAAAQLGAGTAAERIAGVYATAALADIWEQHRQQCIDVLCGYLRLPYDPSSGLLKTVVSEHSWPVGGVDADGRGTTGKETRTYEQLPNDREVRHTIVRVIAAHLRDANDDKVDGRTDLPHDFHRGQISQISWQGYDFDFTGAVFDDDGAPFYRTHFSGGTVTFTNSKFIGSYVDFRRTRFSGGGVSFQRAEFSAQVVTFAGARFSGGLVDFNSAIFRSGVRLHFRHAEVSNGTLSFAGARFYTQGHFDGTRISGGTLDFQSAWLETATLDFGSIQMTGGTIAFDWLHFEKSGFITFNVPPEDVSIPVLPADRLPTRLAGGRITFDNINPADGGIDFEGAEIEPGIIITRDGRDFRGWPPPLAADETPH